MTTTTTKSFTRTIDGKQTTYKRTETGYCFRDGKRIKASEFEAAEVEAMREEKERKLEQAARVRAAIERSEDPTRQDYEERKSDMNVIEIDGVEWANDHINKKVYRDGVECTRAEFNRAVGIGGGKGEKPARKPRRSKDVAFEHGDVTLTAKQADFLRELDAAGEAALGNKGAGWWTDCICDEIGGQFLGKPMAVGAMISTLCEKGLGVRSKESRDQGNGRTKKVTSFNLTDKGREIWEAMGLR
jgi:DNA-binding MarR family transcriptional regulator